MKLPQCLNQEFLQEYDEVADKIRRIDKSTKTCTDLEIFQNNEILEKMLSATHNDEDRDSVKITFKSALLLNYFKEYGKQVYYFDSENCVYDNILNNQMWSDLLRYAPFPAFFTVLSNFEASIIWEDNNNAVCYLKDSALKEDETTILTIVDGSSEVVEGLFLNVKINSPTNSERVIKALKLYFQICYLNKNKQIPQKEGFYVATGKTREKRGKRIPVKKNISMFKVENFQVSKSITTPRERTRTGSAKSPHMRAGHFRTLKCGSRIWINSMKIKGGGPSKIRKVSVDNPEKVS